MSFGRHLISRLQPAPIAALSLCALMTACPGQASAEESPVIDNPPLLRKVQPPPAGGAARPLNLMAKPALNELSPGVDREVAFNLDIQYVNGWIRNPSVEQTGQIYYDKVQLRSYVNGDGSAAHSISPPTQWGPPGQTPFVAPQIEAYPGQTVRITLNNNLPADASCTRPGGDLNTPHCFNGTNLHSHGLWVNPAGNSDNVLISINPGVGFQYEYNIPPTHPAGTFWYHTHRHGSTALQVSSGMAGALIIRGTREPEMNANSALDKNGDIDTLLKPYDNNITFKERVLVFQQIQYACRNGNGQIKTYGNTWVPPNPNDKRYRCDKNDIGAIREYDQFGPKTWQESGRYTSINGVVLGTLAKAKAGDVERWRMIHAGVRDTIALKIRKLKDGAPPPNGLRASAMDDYVSKNCTGDELNIPLIAADGLTMAKIHQVKTAVFQPGYRWDALISFPTAGKYCLVNDVKVTSTIDLSAPSARLLGIVDVDSSSIPSQTLEKVLVDSTKKKFSSAFLRSAIIYDLQNGLKLSRFVPHKDIDPAEVTGLQTLVFNIDTSKDQFQVNGKPYDASRVDRVLKLGGVDEWDLSSDFTSHPFHIHVNPFQIVKIEDPAGNDISAEGKQDTQDNNDPQYPGLKGVWKDTLWVKNLFPGPGISDSKSGQYKITIRTRYERYIGEFVLHCHILDHEDKGMMQNIRIALPDGAGGIALGHH